MIFARLSGRAFLSMRSCDEIKMMMMMMMTPQQYVAGTHYTPGRTETKWSKIPCLRNQRDGRGLNPGPPDPEFEVLTAQSHTPPRGNENYTFN